MSTASDYDRFTPPPRQKGHNWFVKYWYLFTSFFSSLVFVQTLINGAVVYHLWNKITGTEKFNEPVDGDEDAYIPREPYDDISKMKPSKDLRYYCLHLGLELEEYRIITEDDYVLPLHRLIDPKVTPEERNLKKPLLMQHGLLSCSSAFVTPGFNSLAYYFLEQGYDVWLGNNRSWFAPMHNTIEGNLMHSEEYWDWDILHLAYYDLPCIIKTVLSHKPNHDKLVYVGHSQGCAQSILMLRNGNMSEIHKMIEFYVALAPAIFPGNLFHHRSFIKFMHHRGRLAYKLIFGCCSFLRYLSIARAYLYSTKLFGSLSYYMFKYLFGWNARNWCKDRRIWHFNFIFNVTYVSSRLMNWWLSEWVPQGFSNQLLPEKAYKTKANAMPQSEYQVDDSQSYFPFTRQWFTNDLHTVPMLIFTAGQDFLVDGERLRTHMRTYERNYKVDENLFLNHISRYNHVDVIWAEDVIGQIGYVVTKTLAKYKEQQAAATPLEKVFVEPKFPVQQHDAVLGNTDITVTIPQTLEPIAVAA